MVVVVNNGFTVNPSPSKALTLMLFKYLLPLVAVVTGLPLIVTEVLSVVATRRIFSVISTPSPFLKIYFEPTLL